jgi:hypothetical protein
MLEINNQIYLNKLFFVNNPLWGEPTFPANGCDPDANDG